MPNKEHIKLWINGLRSGKYTQGSGQLHSQKGGFCCLGVACEVAIENGLELEKVETSNGFKYEYEFNYLPTKVRDWLGFDYDYQGDPTVGRETLANVGTNKIHAVRANDELNWTFAKIADSLEKMYLNDETDS